MTEKYQPQIDDLLVPDSWYMGEKLTEDDGYSDSSFPGCQFRVETVGGDLAVNVTITGGDHFVSCAVSRRTRKSRCKIEFVGDGEPSIFTGGWLYHE